MVDNVETTETTPGAASIPHKRTIISISASVLTGADTADGVNIDNITNILKDVKSLQEAGEDVIVVFAGAFETGLKLNNLKLAEVDKEELRYVSTQGNDVLKGHIKSIAQSLSIKTQFQDRTIGEVQEGVIEKSGAVDYALKKGDIVFCNQDDTASSEHDMGTVDNSLFAALLCKSARCDSLVYMISHDGIRESDDISAPLLPVYDPNQEDGYQSLFKMAQIKQYEHGAGGIGTKILGKQMLDQTWYADCYFVNGNRPNVLTKVLIEGEDIGTRIPGNEQRKREKELPKLPTIGEISQAAAPKRVTLKIGSSSLVYDPDRFQAAMKDALGQEKLEDKDWGQALYNLKTRPDLWKKHKIMGLIDQINTVLQEKLRQPILSAEDYSRLHEVDPLEYALKEKNIKALVGKIASKQVEGHGSALVLSGGALLGRWELNWQNSQSLGPNASAAQKDRFKKKAVTTAQSALMNYFQAEFKRYKIGTTVNLPSGGDLKNPKVYYDLTVLLSEQVTLRTVPLCNENDLMAVEDLKIGGNDELAAMITNMIGFGHSHAMTILFTDVAGIYTHNPNDPKHNPNDPNVAEEDKARLITCLPGNAPIIRSSAAPVVEGVGTGGMPTKVDCIDHRYHDGDDVVIAELDANNIDVLDRIYDFPYQSLEEFQALSPEMQEQIKPKDFSLFFGDSEAREKRVEAIQVGKPILKHRLLGNINYEGVRYGSELAGLIRPPTIYDNAASPSRRSTSLERQPEETTLHISEDAFNTIKAELERSGRIPKEYLPYVTPGVIGSIFEASKAAGPDVFRSFLDEHTSEKTTETEPPKELQLTPLQQQIENAKQSGQAMLSIIAAGTETYRILTGLFRSDFIDPASRKVIQVICTNQEHADKLSRAGVDACVYSSDLSESSPIKEKLAQSAAVVVVNMGAKEEEAQAQYEELTSRGWISKEKPIIYGGHFEEGQEIDELLKSGEKIIYVHLNEFYNHGQVAQPTVQTTDNFSFSESNDDNLLHLVVNSMGTRLITKLNSSQLLKLAKAQDLATWTLTETKQALVAGLKANKNEYEFDPKLIPSVVQIASLSASSVRSLNAQLPHPDVKDYLGDSIEETVRDIVIDFYELSIDSLYESQVDIAALPEGKTAVVSKLAEETKIFVMGVGNMASAIIEGLINNGHPPENITGTTNSSRSAEQQSKKLGIEVYPVTGPEGETTEAKVERERNIQEAREGSKVVLLGMKPQIFDDELEQGKLPQLSNDQVAVSIMAGKPIAKMSEALGTANIVRTMPNTPSAIGEGVVILCAGDKVNDQDKTLAEELFKAVAQTGYIEQEDQMDMVTALSGSGPAFELDDAITRIKAGVAAGLPENVAAICVLGTKAGAAAYGQSAINKSALGTSVIEALTAQRNAVISLKGTTQWGLQEGARLGLPAAIAAQVLAAERRGKAIGEQPAPERPLTTELPVPHPDNRHTDPAVLASELSDAQIVSDIAATRARLELLHQVHEKRNERDTGIFAEGELHDNLRHLKDKTPKKVSFSGAKKFMGMESSSSKIESNSLSDIAKDHLDAIFGKDKYKLINPKDAENYGEYLGTHKDSGAICTYIEGGGDFIKIQYVTKDKYHGPKLTEADIGKTLDAPTHGKVNQEPKGKMKEATVVKHPR